MSQGRQTRENGGKWRRGITRKDIPHGTTLPLRHAPRRQRPHPPVDKPGARVEAHAGVAGRGDGGPAVVAVWVGAGNVRLVSVCESVGEGNGLGWVGLTYGSRGSA
jgi:hypothetical protein